MVGLTEPPPPEPPSPPVNVIDAVSDDAPKVAVIVSGLPCATLTRIDCLELSPPAICPFRSNVPSIVK